MKERNEFFSGGDNAYCDNFLNNFWAINYTSLLALIWKFKRIKIDELWKRKYITSHRKLLIISCQLTYIDFLIFN